MRSKKKLQAGLVFSIIGLGLFLYHMAQYIDLITTKKTLETMKITLSRAEWKKKLQIKE